MSENETKEKIIFVDTNNYVSCALMTETGYSPNTIEELRKILDSGKAKIILPEVIELELHRIVDVRLSQISNDVKIFVEKIKKNFPPSIRPEKDRYIKSAQNFFPKRKFSSKSAIAKIKTLFKHKNVIRIILTSEIFLNAYRRVLEGKKPYKKKESVNRIDNDCLILESILSKINEFGKIDLIFCSANHKDFGYLDKNTKKFNIHPDIRSSFPSNVSLHYYLHLPEAINEEFMTRIEEAEIEKVKQYDKYFNEYPIWTDILKGISFGVGEAIKPTAELFEKLRKELESKVFQDKMNDFIRYIYGNIEEKKHEEK